MQLLSTVSRILEFESQPEGSGDKICEVELWDCSGDFKLVDLLNII